MKKNIDIKSYYPKTKDIITNIIPGNLYEDEKGIEIVFIGFGIIKDNWKEDDGTYREAWSNERSFIYIKKKKLISAMHKENIENNTKFIDIINKLMYPNKCELLDYFNISEKPRKFIKDLGEYFPQKTNPELLGFCTSDKYEYDVDANGKYVNVNSINCRFGNYWSFDFK